MGKTKKKPILHSASPSSDLKSKISEDPKIVKIIGKQPKTVAERRNKFQGEADKMINLASLETGEKFEARVKVVENIYVV